MGKAFLRATLWKQMLRANRRTTDQHPKALMVWDTSQTEGKLQTGSVYDRPRKKNLILIEREKKEIKERERN